MATSTGVSHGMVKAAASITLGGGQQQQQQQQYQQQQYQQQQYQQQQQRQQQQYDLNGELSRSVSFGRKQQQQQQSSGGEPPRFVKHPRPNATVREGAAVHVECRVAPASDSSMVTEWYKDGVSLNAGSRINTGYDRGYALLDIMHTYPEDSGEYSCVARSNSGMDQSNPMSLTVLAEESVVTETQLPDESMVANIDRLDERLSARSSRQTYDDKIPQAAPQFTKAIEGATVQENSSVRFETRVTPAADPNIQVEWFKNGASVTLGSRIRAVYDRGFTALEIIYCYPEDSGVYCCLATNKLGRAQSNSAQLSCYGSAGVVTSSALPASSVLNLQRLEEYADDFRPLDSNHHQRPEAPRFLSALSPGTLHVPEGSPAAFTAAVAPGNGNQVSLHWFRDGQPVQQGSRVTAGFEMGLARLSFAYANSEDSGTYCAIVVSEHGQQQSNAVQLTCLPVGSGVVTASQLPGDAQQSMRSLMQLEEELTARPVAGGHVTLQQQQQQPVIVRGLGQPPELREGDRLGLQLQVEPSRDGTLTVEWFRDGYPVTVGSRVHTDCERGLAWLQISHCYPEDSGTYWAVARNSVGVAETNRVGVVCQASESVVTKSQLPGGSLGYQRLEDQERLWREAPITADEFQFREQVEPQAPPYFDIMPESATVCEGYPAKFLVKLSGFPRPRVAWYLNDQMIASDADWSELAGSDVTNNIDTSDTSNCKVYHDGSINYLEILRCKDIGETRLRVLARNPLGQIFAEATLTVMPVEDFRPELKHVEPEANYKRLLELRKVERSQELESKINRPKPSVTELLRVERESELKSRLFRDPEVEQAELLYANVQANLRGGHYAGILDDQGQQKPQPQQLVVDAALKPSSPAEGGQDAAGQRNHVTGPTLAQHPQVVVHQQQQQPPQPPKVQTPVAQQQQIRPQVQQQQPQRQMVQQPRPQFVSQQQQQVIPQQQQVIPQQQQVIPQQQQVIPQQQQVIPQQQQVIPQQQQQRVRQQNQMIPQQQVVQQQQTIPQQQMIPQQQVIQQQQTIPQQQMIPQQQRTFPQHQQQMVPQQQQMVPQQQQMVPQQQQIVPQRQQQIVPQQQQMVPQQQQMVPQRQQQIVPQQQQMVRQQQQMVPQQLQMVPQQQQMVPQQQQMVPQQQQMVPQQQQIVSQQQQVIPQQVAPQRQQVVPQQQQVVPQPQQVVPQQQQVVPQQQQVIPQQQQVVPQQQQVVPQQQQVVPQPQAQEIPQKAQPAQLQVAMHTQFVQQEPEADPVTVEIELDPQQENVPESADQGDDANHSVEAMATLLIDDVLRESLESGQL